MSTTLRERAGTALINAAANNATERWLMERSLQTESPESRGYDQARAALWCAEIAEHVMLWVGFRLHQPAVPVG